MLRHPVGRPAGTSHSGTDRAGVEPGHTSCFARRRLCIPPHRGRRGGVESSAEPQAAHQEVEPGATDTRFLSCVYWTADDKSYANVGHREALTPAGAADNKAQFANQRTADAVAIPGLGDDAYWDTPNGQILVLVGDDLLLISTGTKKEQEMDTRSRPDTTKLASLVATHLHN